MRHVFIGDIDAQQLIDWRSNLDMSPIGDSDGLYVFIDYTQTKRITPDALDIIIDIQKEAKKAGLKRAAVVVNSGVMQMQTERMARSSAIHSHERYISCDRTPHWEEAALAWLSDGIEPSAYFPRS